MRKKHATLAYTYHQYVKKRRTKTGLLSRFRLAMPEIIFRTTKLEGEPVTRKMVRALFK